MIYLLINFFHNTLEWKTPAVFTYTSTRMILAAMTTLLICIFCGPRFIKKLYELKIGQPIRMEECPLLGELHKNKKNTPTMGGLLILISMLIAMFFWMDLSNIFTLILFLTTIVFGGLGAVDDYLKLKYKNPKGISAKTKLFVQAALSIGIALYLFVPSFSQALHLGELFSPPLIKDHRGAHSLLTLQEYASRIYFPFFKDPLLITSLLGMTATALFMMFVITGCSNAVNLTDGLDGLAAGCVSMVALAFAAIAFLSNNVDFAKYLNILYVEGSGEIAIYLCAFVGACLGFLWYNGYPAQVFMGDTGSLALGGILGVSAVLLRREFLLAIVGGIFVVEALSVIIQVGSYKLRNKKRVFLCTPLHHHFEYKGWPETKIVIRFWILALLLSFIGIVSLKFQ